MELPDAEQGIVTSRSYSEQAGAVGRDGSLSVQVEIMTPLSASGEVDLDANPLQTMAGANITSTAGVPFMTTDN